MNTQSNSRAGASILPWQETSQGKALLAACMANPPRKFPFYQQYALTREEWTAYDLADERVIALNAFVNRYFLENEAAHGTAVAGAAIKLRVDDAIDLVLAQGAERRAA